MNYKEPLKKELLNSSDLLLKGEIDILLLHTLKSISPCLSFAPILKFIPEQSENIYWVMIDANRIAIIEVPRLSNKVEDVLIEILDVEKYKKKISSKESRRTLATAIELMREK